MGKLLLLALVMVVGMQANAQSEAMESRGTSLVQDLDHNQSFIEIKGDAAKQLFEAMDLDLMSGIDAGENNGVRTMMKIGESMTCYQYIELKKDVQYDCSIVVVNNLKGKIGKGQ